LHQDLRALTFLLHHHGPALLALLCGLIFAEECGVPIPFAPGDVLLALCGLAIRRGGLSPIPAIAAVYLTTLLGAMCGREAFALAGSRLLRRLIAGTRLRGPFERAADLLQRKGWRAVMVARLTPGMRVTTTEVAGLLNLPRLTFLAGLAPAAAVYVGVFVGAGALLGPHAVRLLISVSHQFGWGVAVVAAVALWAGGAWLLIRFFQPRQAPQGRA
jgi:membrane-associated protein